jgi:hypothetical protein
MIIDARACSATFAWLYTATFLAVHLLSVFLFSRVEKYAKDRFFVDTTLLPTFPSL